ncbi:choice-of-anchor F family protein [Yoonia sp. I 8.24]|uniref:choice-of-anchor F family protein n=1 Tax=Yoonia sp. I 8.24 TaxID=1537229 RepID=UPI001EDEB122|nr:choice-of-anchor F family protein [Yoonia sp. I 8.24]MCG3269549.1 autotransporter outer membrane beta-barrel domain-containing protein [Yoonia sp. I 8.24]
MMTNRSYLNRTVAPAALFALICGPAFADTFDDNPLIETSGGGFIYVDTTEGVVEPGIGAVTFTATRDENDNFVPPFESIITDFSDLVSRGEVTNCLKASNPGVYCDSESGSGKRIKIWLTGRDATNIRLRTTASVDHPSVDYFTFGKTSNYSGARMTGFSLELLDADGNPMGELAPENAVLFNLDATDIGIGSRLVDGLFGEGGQENDIGFFSDERAAFDRTTSDDALTFGALSNTVFNEHFGTAYLDDSMVPDGLFWDDNDDPNDEASLVAWNNIAGGGWTYGSLSTDEGIDARLAELATSLGVDVAALGYVAGGLVPADIVATAEANGLFSVGAIEDLRNANLNYTMTVGTIDGGEVIVRIVPTFAPIVENTSSEYQFKTAGYLDAAANVPYWDLGNATAYEAAIAEILAMETTESLQAIESVGFGYAAALSNSGFEASRDQIAAVMGAMPWGQDDEASDVAATRAGVDSWLVRDDLYGFVSLGGSQSSYASTSSSIGYDIALTAFTLGMEKRLANGNSSIGLALGYANGSASAYQDLGEIDSEGFSLTGFSRTRFGNGGLVQALVGYQDLSYESERSVMGETASGTPDGSQIFAALKVDYLKDFGSFKVGPTASVELYNGSTDSFTETGADLWNLEVDAQTSRTVLASVGVSGEYRFDYGNNPSHLSGSIEFTKASGDDLVVASGFVGLPSTSYIVDGMDENLVDVSLGFESVISSGAHGEISLQTGYRGSFGDDYESQGVHVGLSASF